MSKCIQNTFNLAANLISSQSVVHHLSHSDLKAQRILGWATSIKTGLASTIWMFDINEEIKRVKQLVLHCVENGNGSGCLCTLCFREVSDKQWHNREGKRKIRVNIEPTFARFDYVYPGKLHKVWQVFLLRVWGLPQAARGNINWHQHIIYNLEVAKICPHCFCFITM